MYPGYVCVLLVGLGGDLCWCRRRALPHRWSPLPSVQRHGYVLMTCSLRSTHAMSCHPHHRYKELAEREAAKAAQLRDLLLELQRSLEAVQRDKDAALAKEHEARLAAEELAETYRGKLEQARAAGAGGEGGACAAACCRCGMMSRLMLFGGAAC